MRRCLALGQREAIGEQWIQAGTPQPGFPWSSSQEPAWDTFAHSPCPVLGASALRA